MKLQMTLLLAAIFALVTTTGCEKSPCDQLTETWMDCYCEGAKPHTTRPQSTIDEACESPEAFIASDDEPIPEREQKALTRCNDEDAEWALRRMEKSECNEGAYVCGSKADDNSCDPPD